MNETQICKKCKEELPLDSFSKNNQMKTGRQNMCRVCHRLHRIELGIQSSNHVGRPKKLLNTDIDKKQEIVFNKDR